MSTLSLAGLMAAWLFSASGVTGEPAPLPGTQPLTLTGDIASNLVAGVDRFLLDQLARSIADRGRYWAAGSSSSHDFTAAVTTNRLRLAHLLGVRDARPNPPRFEFVSTSPTAWSAAPEPGLYRVDHVRWEAVAGVHGEGLYLRPQRPAQAIGLGPGAILRVVAIPDADQTPEQIAGLMPGLPADAQFARRLAESGCEVVVPALINRQTGTAKSTDGQRGKSLTNREYLYRPAFELGRHLTGYELQMVLAAVDSLGLPSASVPGSPSPAVRVGIIGWGEGGRLALFAGALDPRIDAVAVSGYFGPREAVWEEPIDRNVFGLLERFGDAELAMMIHPRRLIVEVARGPEATVPPGTGGGPGRLRTPTADEVSQEIRRATLALERRGLSARFSVVSSGDGHGLGGTPEALSQFLQALDPAARVAPSSPPPEFASSASAAAERHQRLFREIDQHTQQLLVESPYVRAEFMKQLDFKSTEAYERSAAPYREVFYREVIGRFDTPLLAPNPRSRLTYREADWIGYEVVLDVFPEVIAYGVLLVPNNLKPGERRPVVVCQHGLEGRPQDIIQGDHAAYHDFAAGLCRRGFITFAPQNLYLFGDRFRTLQRKANPLGKTLFSIITPQHQQITDWLRSLPFVDPQRIAFYGLSYGGKTAMRVPALVTNYCLSICSADFNEWVWKNASTRSPYSYVWTGEYEIFEFDLGSTFNYAEMAALIAPRPFMVERGHFDGVAPDETVGYEFAKVRHLYAARLGLGDRCEIEWFVGPHTIHGEGTFAFLHRHLDWPAP